MPWVMVPVPEEHQAEFTEELMTLAMSTLMATWDAERVGTALDLLSADQRRFVVLVARESAEGRSMGLEALAAALELDPDTVIGRRDEVNRLCHSKSLPELVLFDPRPEISPTGESRPRNLFALGPSVARLVLDAVDAT